MNYAIILIMITTACTDITPTTAPDAPGPKNTSTSQSLLAGIPPTLIVYDNVGNRLGALIQNAYAWIQPALGDAGGFITFGTTAFNVPDGSYLSMYPRQVYFTNPNCQGQPYFALNEFWDTPAYSNRLIWTAFAVYQISTITDNVTLNTMLVDNVCNSTPHITALHARLTPLTTSWNPKTSTPWTIAIE